MKSYLTITTIPFLLLGCTYWKPLIKNVEYQPNSLNGSQLQETKKALSSINDSLKDAIDKRDSNIQTARTLDIATFGLGTGAAGYGLRSGHVNAIKNLAFASGATYIGSTLFASNDTTLIYDKVANSLACIYNAGETYYTFVNVGLKTGNDCDQDSRVDEIKNTIIKKIYVIQSSDSAVAHDLMSSANKIIESANTQIIKNSPSPASIFNSSQLAAKFNSFPIKTAQNAKAQAQAITHEACTEEFNRLEVLNKEIDNQINALSSIGDTCVLNLPSANSELQVANTEIMLSSDEKFILEVTGGKTPYKISLPENQKELKVITLPTSFLFLTKTVSPSTTIKATVSDSSTVPKTKEINIEFK